VGVGELSVIPKWWNQTFICKGGDRRNLGRSDLRVSGLWNRQENLDNAISASEIAHGAGIAVNDHGIKIRQGTDIPDF